MWHNLETITSYTNNDRMAEKNSYVYSVYVNGGPDVRVFPKEYWKIIWLNKNRFIDN